jgi:hypothetical protein
MPVRVVAVTKHPRRDISYHGYFSIATTRSSCFFVHWAFYLFERNIYIGGSVHTIKTVDLVAASRESGLEVNADKTSTLSCFGIRITGGSHSIKIDTSSIERMEDFSYKGTILSNQTFNQEEIMGRLKSGNVFYHSVHDLLSSSLLSKNIKIKMYKTIILCSFLWCELCGYYWWRNVGLRCLRIGCWEVYLGLRGTR